MKVLIATGWEYPDSLGKNTEIIDLEDSTFSCTKVKPFPVILYSANGGLIEGKIPFLCGGRNWIYGVKRYKDCYQLNEDGSWAKDPKASLSTARSDLGYGSIVLNNNLYISGGSDGSSLTLIEMLSPDTTSKIIPVQLPIGIQRHCQVPWDSETFLLIGGTISGQEYRDETYYINVITNQLTNGPSLNTGRYYHTCDELEVSGKSYIIVTGGFPDERSTEVLDKSNVGQGWLKGNTIEILNLHTMSRTS